MRLSTIIINQQSTIINQLLTIIIQLTFSQHLSHNLSCYQCVIFGQQPTIMPSTPTTTINDYAALAATFQSLHCLKSHSNSHQLLSTLFIFYQPISTFINFKACLVFRAVFTSTWLITELDKQSLKILKLSKSKPALPVNFNKVCCVTIKFVVVKCLMEKI